MSTSTGINEPIGATDGRPDKRNRIVVASGVALALVMVAYVVMSFSMRHSVPGDLDLSTTQMSAQGHYLATIMPDSEPIPVNRLHAWTLRVETADSEPVDAARITVDGDMPQHRHGLPTQPQVTRYLGDGEYLVEGMRFQMGGWWVVDFTIEHGGQSDTVRFNLMLD